MVVISVSSGFGHLWMIEMGESYILFDAMETSLVWFFLVGFLCGPKQHGSARTFQVIR